MRTWGKRPGTWKAIDPDSALIKYLHHLYQAVRRTPSFSLLKTKYSASNDTDQRRNTDRVISLENHASSTPRRILTQRHHRHGQARHATGLALIAGQPDVPDMGGASDVD